MRKFDYNQTPRIIAETLRGRKSKTHSSMRKIFERPCSAGAGSSRNVSVNNSDQTYFHVVYATKIKFDPTHKLTSQMLCTVKYVARSEDNYDFSFWNFMCGDGFNFRGIAHMKVGSSCFMKSFQKVK